MVQQRPKHEVQRRPTHEVQHVQFFTRCAIGTAFLPKIMESPRWSSAIIMEIGRSPILFYKVCQGHGLPTQDYGEPKRQFCHHHGDRPLVGPFYKVCQGHSLSTQDYGEPKRKLCRHHGDQPLIDSFYKVCQGFAPSYPRLWRAQEGALPSSWRSAAGRFFHFHAHGEPKKELCHYYGILRKTPFNLSMYLFACVIFVYSRVRVSLFKRDID